MSDVLIEADHLHKRYGERDVVQQVSLRVHAGEIVTLIGPNGAGKTTVLKMLLGLEKADSGSIHRLPKLRVGYMPQRFEIDPALPLDVASFLGLYMPDRRRLMDVVHLVGIEPLMQMAVQQLSGGEWRRVLLARAMLRKPQLLILDEPMAGVDVSGQAELYRLIENLVEQTGCGVLMVSHDLHVVMASTHQVICLNGHVCCEGKPSQLGSNPEFIRLFGPDMAKRLALYSHHHDHAHSLHGVVLELDTDEYPDDGCCGHGHHHGMHHE